MKKDFLCVHVLKKLETKNGIFMYPKRYFWWNIRVNNFGFNNFASVLVITINEICSE